MDDDLRGMTSGEMLVAAIYSLSRRIMMLYSAAVQRETGLSWQDWRILRAVVRLQSCRARDICAEIGIKKPHVSTALARLERHGHIRREGDRGDGRSKIVRSTERGQQLVARAAPRLKALEDRLASPAPDPAGDPRVLLDSLRSYQQELDRLLAETTRGP